MTNDIMNSVIHEFVDKFIHEIKQKKNQKYITTYLIDPSISYCIDRLYPYILIISLLLIIFFSMMLGMLFISIKSYRKG
jgi:hypothetical protein